MFEIEKNVPITPKHRAGEDMESRYPFRSMEPGDSFLINATGELEKKRALRRVCAAIKRYVRRHEGHFTSRTVEDGIRVWRVG